MQKNGNFLSLTNKYGIVTIITGSKKQISMETCWYVSRVMEKERENEKKSMGIILINHDAA